ncbi:hypothetical protein FBZ89_101257 [Nitrospirillum amazonense]|uniref:4-amino-4-deoxy-L-arabinose transferase-like glycosyltransferase n=1 Tax=Nitrospirillum amazonense TaxID=28077 RepID=A0A560FSU2_9PROT|nr:hypothetical protein [Nitrospirillum amazonense]TWB24631.1 hypothetical protein FBZ89_101257 [Nitrospirillum amazonense]
MKAAGVGFVIRSFIVAALLVLAAVVVSTTILAVVRFGSATLVWDQWSDLQYTHRLADGNLQFKDLFSQHNEHRIFFPRLIFFLDYLLANCTNAVNLTVNILIPAGTLAAILVLGRKIERSRAVFLGLSGVAAVLLFSLSQRENFLWGFQVQFFGAVSAPTAAFLVFSGFVERARRGRASLGLLGLACFLALVATYTLSNGILAAFLLVPMAVILRAGRMAVLTVALWAVGVAFSYFLNFHPVPGHSPYVYSLTHPIEYLGYVSGYLGNLMTCLGAVEPARSRWSILLGAAGLVLTLAALARTLRNWEEAPARIALLAIILFVLGTAMLTALGRITFGLEQAYSGRYLTPVSVFWVGHIFYWAPLRRLRDPLGVGMALAGMALVALLAWCGVQGELRGWQEAIPQALNNAKVRDAFISEVRDEPSYRLAYPEDDYLLSQLSFVRDHHLSSFADPDNRLLGQAPTWLAAAPADQCLGAIDIMQVLSSDRGDQVSLTVTGWAWNVTRREAVPRVLFTDAANRIVGYAGGGWPRPDVPTVMPMVRSGRVGWVGFLKGGMTAPIKAYGLMPGHRVCKIGERMVPESHARLVPLSALGADIPLPSAPELSGGWARDGQNPAAGPLPGGDVVYGSWGGADGNVGELRIGPFMASQPRLAFPVVTGPHAENQAIVLLDAATGAELARYSLMLSTQWTGLEIQLPQAAMGKAVILVFRDQGAGWGEWSAVGGLHETAVDAP